MVSKASQIAPDAPTLEDKTATTITLKAVSGCEYNINSGSYQASPLFFGLMPNTSYIFTQRKLETATHLASPASPTATFTTDETHGNTYTITASVNNANWGTITPSGACVVEEGESITFTIAPSAIGEIEDVKVNGTSKGAISTFTFENVTANGTIEAIFKEYVGINENVVGNITVFPNPTNGELTITCVGNQISEYGYPISDNPISDNPISEIVIFDVYGRKVSSNHLINTSSNHLINISHLPAGIYFLCIQTDKGKVMKKVVKY